jgi:hypothetical protein
MSGGAVDERGRASEVFGDGGDDMSETSGESQVIEVSYLHTNAFQSSVTAPGSTQYADSLLGEPLPPLPDLPVLNLDDDNDNVDNNDDVNVIVVDDNPTDIARDERVYDDIDLATAELVKLISSDSLALVSASEPLALYSDSSSSPATATTTNTAAAFNPADSSRSADYVLNGTASPATLTFSTGTRDLSAAHDLQIDSLRAGLGGEFAGDSFYDSDDYVLQQNAIRVAAGQSFIDGYDDVDQVAVHHAPSNATVSRSVEDEVYGTFAELVKGNYAAISLVQADAEQPPPPRSNYQRLLTDSERETTSTQYDSIEIPRSNYQRLHTDSELFEIAAAAAAASGKPRLAYVQLPAEQPGSKPGSGSLRHSVSESRISARRELSPAEREARSNYGELPKKQPDIASVAAAHAALVASSPDAFGSTSPKLGGATSPTAATSPMVGSSRSARLRRIDRRHLPSLSTMRNGDIACEQCRSTAFAHKLPLESGPRDAAVRRVPRVVRQEQATRAMPPSYGQLPVKALEAQRSDLIAAIGRIETTWGRRPKGWRRRARADALATVADRHRESNQEAGQAAQY